MKTAFLAASGVTLAIAGFAAGWLTAPPAPIPDTYLDISAASEGTRQLLTMPGGLKMLGEYVHVEDGGISLYEPAQDLTFRMPAGFPAWPSKLWLSPPYENMRWIDAAFPGSEVLAASKSRWTVVNLWATWCAPCLAELPDFEALASALDGKVGVFAINVDTTGNDTAQEVSALFADKGYAALKPLHAPRDASAKILEAAGYTYAAYPMTIIFTPGGKPFAYVRDALEDWSEGHSGWGGPEMLAFFEKLSTLPAPG